jgi:hypothetical protein
MSSDGLDAAARDFQGLRRRLERAIPPGATSVDGRTFAYQAPVGSDLVPPGGFVALVHEGGRTLGQVIDQRLTLRDGPSTGTTIAGAGLGDESSLALNAQLRLRVIEGDGQILDVGAPPFVDAAVEPATPEEVQAYFDRAGGEAARLPIGSLALVEGDLPAVLDASGFDRHTFLCGQSGSGKTYSLGVVLEQLLLETELRIVVIDPNSDFVRIAEARPAADPELAARLEALAPAIRVRRPGSDRAADRLRLRFAELDDAARGGVLRLDPVMDSEEYAELLQTIEDAGGGALARFGPDHASSISGGDPGALLTRVRNLGVDRWPLWARDQAGSLLEELDSDDWRCLVVDIGTLGSPEEKSLVAQAVLGRLWQRRTDRRPLLIVIDEAHNVCPQLPQGALQSLATDYAIRIAAEGRKFGLYLLVSTQRPQKVHENVISQCDNLLLMRMNSTADLAHLTDVFSYVPATLLERATGFKQGEALVAGKIIPLPTFVRFGARVTEEGGSDVPADWAHPRT